MKARRPILVGVVALALAAGLWLALRPDPARHLLLSNVALSPIAGEPGSYGLFLTVENTGGPDRIAAGEIDGAPASFTGPAPEGLPIPAQSSPALAADGAFLRVDGADLDHGALVPVALDFAEAGRLRTRARVIDPTAEGAAAAMGLFGLGDICRVGEGEPAPAIALSVEPAGAGWRVVVEAEQFTFTEHLAGGPHYPGTGHGHLYLDGVKLQRLYGSEAVIGALLPGTYEVRVTLNTNDHRAYVVDDEPVTAAARIVVN